jgi:hypothetical protein
MFCFEKNMKMMMGLWSLWAKGSAVGKSRGFCDFSTVLSGSLAGFASELSTRSTTLFLVSVRQLVRPWGHQARMGAKSVAPTFTENPNGCLGQ